MEQILKRATGDTLEHLPRVDGVVDLSISTAACTLYHQDGRLFKPTSSCSVAPDGIISLVLNETETSEYLDWGRAEFTYVGSVGFERHDEYFHIAAHRFEPDLWSEELFILAPWLKNRAGEEDPVFAETRQAARHLLYSRLVNAGRQPWKIQNMSALDGAFSALWISLASEQISADGDDIWGRRAEDYRVRFEDAFGRLNLIETGDVDADGARSRPLNRSRIRRA